LEKTTTVKTVAINTNQTISGLNVAPCWETLDTAQISGYQKIGSR